MNLNVLCFAFLGLSDVLKGPFWEEVPKDFKKFEFKKEFKIEFPIKSEKSPTGAGSGSSKDGEDYKKFLPMIGISVAALFFALSQLRYKEITWKDFINNYLYRGTVASLEVVNKKYVRVKFLPGAQSTSGEILWFNIGSVDTFERNLERIQMQMNVEPANYVPVVYKTELEM